MYAHSETDGVMGLVVVTFEPCSHLAATTLSSSDETALGDLLSLGFDYFDEHTSAR